jgi:hypothetical protein
MPKSVTSFQAMLGALGTLAFLLANAWRSPAAASNERVSGVIDHIEDGRMTLRTEGGEIREFAVKPEVVVYLNARRFPFSTVAAGRKAGVRYHKKRGKLIAVEIDLFPSREEIGEQQSRST